MVVVSSGESVVSDRFQIPSLIARVNYVIVYTSPCNEKHHLYVCCIPEIRFKLL